MAVPTTTSGKVGKGLVGAVVIHLTKWTVDDDADELDATTAEDDGFGVSDDGVEQCSGTMEGVYTVGVTKLDHMKPGRGVTLKLYTYKKAADLGPFWDIPNFTIHGLQQSSEVRGQIRFSCKWKSRGAFSRPIDPI